MLIRLPAGLKENRVRQFWYVPVLALAMGLMMARLLVMARILDLTAFAIYSAGLLVSSSFLMLGCLGLQSLLQRELPILIVRRREYAGGILSMQCALIASGCAVIGVFAVLLSGISIAGLPASLLAIALIHGLSLQLFLVATVDSRSRGQPLCYAWQNLGRALILLIAGSTIAAFGLGVAEVLLTELVSSLLLSAWLFRKQFYAIPIRLRAAAILAWRRFKFISWRSSFALLAVSSFSFIVINADRWVAAQMLPVAAFAQYSFAWTVLMVAQSVQVLINTSFFPLLARCFAGQGGQMAYKITIRVSLGVFACSALIALPLWVVLDYSITRWFVAYQEAGSLLPLFLIVAVLRLSDFWSSYLLVIGREFQLLIFNFIGASVGTAVWMLSDWMETDLLSINHVALLTFLLTVSGYVLSVWGAWHYSKVFRKQAV